MIHASGSVRRRRHQVGDERRRLPARLDDDHLVMHRVAAGPPHPDARHDRLVVVHELEDAGLGERHVSCPAGSSRDSARADASHPPTRRAARRTARAGSAAARAPPASRAVKPPA